MNFYLLLSSGIVGSAPQEIDEYELVDPVDILTPLEKSGFWEGVVSSPLECIFRGNALAFFVIMCMLASECQIFVCYISFSVDTSESYQMVREERGGCRANQAGLNQKNCSW